MKYLLKGTLCIFASVIGISGMAEKLEIGSPDLSQLEQISSLEKFKPSPNDFRIYYVGNSITRHGFNKTTIEKLKWGHVAGMAASSEEKDFAHILANNIKKYLPQKNIKIFFGGGSLKGIDNARIFLPQLVIIQHGEHVPYKQSMKDAKEEYEKLLEGYRQLPSKPMIIAAGVWSPQKGTDRYKGRGAEIEAMQKSACREKGIPFVSVEKYAVDPKCSGTGGSGGVRWHPNDAGQAGYAKEIFAAFKENYNTAPKNKADIEEPENEVVFKSDFSSIPENLKINRKVWKINSGAIENIGDGYRAFNLTGQDLNEFTLDSKLKLIREEVKGKGGHGGFIFHGSNADLRVYLRDLGAFILLTKDKKTVSHERYDFSGGVKIGKDAPWNSVKIIFNKKDIEVNVNGRLIDTVSNIVGTVNRIEVYSYLANIALEDLEVNQRVYKRKTVADDNCIGPAFYADFDDNLDAQSGNGSIKPQIARNLSFVEGVKGKAVFLGTRKNKGEKNSLLEYPAGNIFKSNSGTVMFWFKPDWDGKILSRNNFPWYYLLYCTDLKNKQQLNIFMWHWLRCDVARNQLKPVSLERRCRNNILKNEWWHLSFVWNDNGWLRLYVNGLPYEHGGGKRSLPLRTEAFLKNIEKIFVGSVPNPGGSRNNANGAFDELKIYKRPLSENEVINEYRKVMPVDIIMERRFFPEETPEKLELELGPGGTFAIPQIAKISDKALDLKIDLELTEKDKEKVLTSKTYTLSLTKRKTLSLDLPPLPKGLYTLACKVHYDGYTTQRSFNIGAYKQEKLKTASTEPLKWGKPFIAINCPEEQGKAIFDVKPHLINGPGKTECLEAGNRKGNRFSFEIEFPDSYVESDNPVLIEIDWPDNVPRSAAFYMYPEAPFKQHRDRLGGGIQSGEEYPLTGKMTTSKYLFYPGVNRYLFEARTMVTGMPAAVAAVRFKPLLGAMPKLKINYPKDLPGRTLGHMDEDQTFEINMNWDNQKERFGDLYQIIILQRMCDYFDYTGQSVISYPLLRYSYTLLDWEGQYRARGLLATGFVFAFLDMLQHRNMKMIATVNLYSLPQIWLRPDKYEEFQEQNYFAVSSDGMPPSPKVLNPVNPAVRKFFLENVSEIIKRFGRHPALKGIDLWCGSSWTFKDLKYGYGDYTVSLFIKETGADVPDFKGPGRFLKRYEVLTGPFRKEWLAWRAQKSAELVKAVSEQMRKVNPELKLYINPIGIFHNKKIMPLESTEGLDLRKFFYENFALDFELLKELPNTQISAMRNVTGYRWFKHWDNSESIFDDINYNPDLWQSYRKNNQAPSWSYLRYFETFNNSLKPEIYQSYFQNADVKPWGRYFLKEWAFCLAAMDSNMMLIGAQPLGTLGREKVAREFAMAYCALPALPFKDVKNMSDPVTARFLNTDQGTYFYLVNTCFGNVSVNLSFSEDFTAENLSSGAKLKSREKTLAFSLKPFEMKSFLIKGEKISIVNGFVKTPKELKEYFDGKLSNISQAISNLKRDGNKIDKFEKVLASIRKEIDQGHIASASRLINSSLMRNLNKLNEASKSGALKEQNDMIKNGRYAVNCGSAAWEYYKSPDGTLFWPDKAFSKDSYGYGGSYKKVGRDISQIKGTESVELFATEAYDIDSYKFTLPNGTYTLKLYFKLGWKPSAKPDCFLINVDVEGKKVLENMDIFLESGSDFDNVFIKEIKNIKVSDGVMDIQFSVPSGIDSTARLCNAIEIIKTE